MDNESILSEIISGTNTVEKVEFEGLSKPLTLRVLNNGELLELKKMERGSQKSQLTIKRNMKRQDVKDKVEEAMQEIDPAQIQENIENTKALALELSADITRPIYDQLKPGLTTAIFDKIMEISQITSDDLDLIKDFREN
jgi:hypothetical protein